MKDCKGGVLYTELSAIQKYWLNRTQLHRMVYDCPNYLDPSIEFTMENVPKLRSLYNLLHHEAENEDTVLVFTYYKEAQYALSEWLTSQGITNKILNGDVTNKKKRDDIIQGFKNAEYRVLITNVQKGLNFGACNFCIFYSFDPNPSRMIQFEGRTTRSFDIIGKNVYILCSKGAEEKTLLNVVKQRTKETANFTNTDLSVVLSVLLSTTGGDNNDDDFAYWSE
jgi:ERCC4-related helicase